MGLRWGREGPPEVAYSRVTRDLSEVYAGLPADVSRRLQRLAGEFEVRVRRGRPSELDLRQPWPDDARVAGIREVFVLTPARRSAAVLEVAITEVPTLMCRTTSPHWFGVPACTCDACDTDLDEALGELEQVIDDVTGGGTERVSGLRRVRVEQRFGATTSTVWHTPGEARALGVRRGRREWAPWPARSLARDI
jgi:hypothetical protein